MAPLISSICYVVSCNNGLFAPNWRITTTNCLSWCSQILIPTLFFWHSPGWTFDCGFSTGTGVVDPTHTAVVYTWSYVQNPLFVVCLIIKTELYKWKSAVLRWVMDWNIPWPQIVCHITPHETFKCCFSTPGFVHIKMFPIRAAQTCAPGPKLACHKVRFIVSSNKVI